MADLKEKYTDIRNRTHTVEHITMQADDKSARERIVEELLYVLGKSGEQVLT